jgi:hypothetical protein
VTCRATRSAVRSKHRMGVGLLGDNLLEDAPRVVDLTPAHGRGGDEEVLVGVDDPQRASGQRAQDGDDLGLGGWGRARPVPVQ